MIETLKEALTRIESYTGRGSEVSRDTNNCVNSTASSALFCLDVPQPDPRDAIIAEAVEVMRTLSPIEDVPIFRDEEPVVLRVGNFGEYVYMPLGAWSIFRAARAFVEKHGGGR